MEPVTSTEIYAVIGKTCTDLNVNALTPEQNLRHYGYDSMDMMNILLELEERYTLTISDYDAVELVNINAIVAYLNKRKCSQ